VLVLRFFKEFTLKLVLFNHQFFFHLIDFKLVATHEVCDFFFALLAFLDDLVRRSLLNLANLLFQPVILHFKHLFDSRALSEN